jgi:hypothetical protein
MTERAAVRIKADPRQQPRGADRDRTDNLVVANHALSQLSYGPAAPMTPLQHPDVLWA